MGGGKGVGAAVVHADYGHASRPTPRGAWVMVRDVRGARTRLTGTTLTTAHHEAGESILEDLLESEAVAPSAPVPSPVEDSHSQLEDREVDGGVQTETALVRTESRVELDSETAVDGDREVVALPGDSELDDALGDLDDGEGAAVLGVLLEELERVRRGYKGTAAPSE